MNGSNRIDGFDVAAVSMRAALARTDTDYRRDADVNLDGIINGDDLALVAERFGDLRKVGSPLRATVLAPLAPDPDTVTCQQLSAEGDLLTIRLLVNDDDDPVSHADFAVTYGPSDDVEGQVLELLDDFTPGSYLGGGFGQGFKVDRSTPGVVTVEALRLPLQDKIGSGQQPLMDLIFQARREGEASLDFAPFQYSRATLLNASELEVPGVEFLGPVTVRVEATGEDPVAQRIGIVPSALDFGAPSPGATSSRTMRISNFGFADVTVANVRSTLPDFTTFFGSPFAISQFGFVELTAEYAADRAGLFAGELVIELGGKGHVDLRVPVLGRVGLDLTATPSHLEFGAVAVGGQRVERIVLTNSGETALSLLSVISERPEFEPQVDFSALPPHESTVLEVRFQPVTTGEVHGLLHLSFDSPSAETAILSLSGEGL